jgi:hypothetical protein
MLGTPRPDVLSNTLICSVFGNFNMEPYLSYPHGKRTTGAGGLESRTDFLRNLMERQSRLAILFNVHDLPEDEDLVDVRWRNCRARVRPTYGRKPLAQA